MFDYIDCFGLTQFITDKETTDSLLDLVANKGRKLYGYYGFPYHNLTMGWVEFIETFIEENNKCTLTSAHMHLAGICKWDVKFCSVYDDTKHTKYMLCETPNGHKSIAILRMVNADVIPSYATNECITAQVVGLPETMMYFKDEAECDAAIQEICGPTKLSFREGLVLPYGTVNEECVEEKLAFSVIKGKVEGFFNGEFEYEGLKNDRQFIDCVINTDFGKLEIVHQLDAIKEEQHKNIKPGSFVLFVGLISADVAIDQYSDGMVLDLENNLRLLSYVATGGDPERLRSVLVEDVTYVSENNRIYPSNADQLIDYFKYVQGNVGECHSWLATISRIEDENMAVIDGRVYPIGTRCLALTYGDKDEIEQIMFVDVNAEGKINNIYVKGSPGYVVETDIAIPKAIENTYLKNITEQSRQKLSAFANILRDLKIPQEESLGLISMITSDEMLEEMMKALEEKEFKTTPQETMNVCVEVIEKYL